jgi:hypothetical protein
MPTNTSSSKICTLQVKRAMSPKEIFSRKNPPLRQIEGHNLDELTMFSDISAQGDSVEAREFGPGQSFQNYRGATIEELIAFMDADPENGKSTLIATGTLFHHFCRLYVAAISNDSRRMGDGYNLVPYEPVDIIQNARLMIRIK